MAVRKHDFDDGEQAAQTANDSQITVKVNSTLRRRIEAAAAHSHLSIAEFLEHLIEEAVPEEEISTRQQVHPVTHEAIERLHRTRKELMQNRKGRFFENSALGP